MKKVLLSVLIVLGAQFICSADTWSEMLRAYKLDLSTLTRGDGYQIFRSEAGGLGIAYSETDAEGQCHFSLAMVPVEARAMRWLPQAGASFVEIQDYYGYASGVMVLQEAEGPETDPKLGSFTYLAETHIFLGPDGRILNLGYLGDKLIFLVERDSGVFWVGEDGQKVDIPAADPPLESSAQTLRIEDTRAVDIGLSVFWADRNVGADAPQAYGDYFSFGTPVPWGGAWRTPSVAELAELIEKCSWEQTLCEGVDGYRVTGPNGNAIFIPLGGDVWEDGGLDRPGTTGAIWSSERDPHLGDSVVFLQMNAGASKYSYYLRSFFLKQKRNLRPVMPKP